MKNISVAMLALACSAPALALAGEVYGTISTDAGPVGAGAQVAAACSGGKYGPVATDKTGGYRLVIKETGKCTLTVTHDGRSGNLEVVSFDDAAQVDVVVKPDAAGKLVARRK